MLLGGTGGGNINLGFRFYLDDQFSGPAANVKNTLSGIRGEFGLYRQNLAAARNSLLAIGTAAVGVAAGMTTAAIAGAQFLYTMQGVLAISEATSDEFENLTTKAIKIGRETIFTPSQVASGMRFMAMAGQTAKQIDATSEAVTHLAAATMTPIGGKMGAADILTNALKAFGLEAEQSALMSDLLTHAVTSANVSLIDVGNSIRYVASTSKNLNIPIQDTIGFLMTLGNAGIQSSMAGTALENMYRYLAMSLSDFATKRQQTAWQTIGLSKRDVMTASGQFRPMVEVLSLINDRVSKLGAVKRQNILKEIFGVRGQRAAGTILRNLDQAGGFIEQLHSGAIKGTAERKSSLMMETLEGSLNRLASAWEGMQSMLAKGLFGKTLVFIIESLATAITWLSNALNTTFGGILAAGIASMTAMLGITLLLKGGVIGLAYAYNTLSISLARMTKASNIAMFSMGLGGGPGAKMAASRAKHAGLIHTRAMGQHSLGPKPTTAPAGSTMFMGKGGRQFIRHPGGGVKRVPKGSGMVSSLKRSPSIAKKLPMLIRGIGGVAKGLFAFLGGWPMVVFAGIFFLLPPLINWLSNLTNATKENTDVMRQGQRLASGELLKLVEDLTGKEMMQRLRDNMASRMASDPTLYEYFKKALDESDMKVILETIAFQGDPSRAGTIVIPPEEGKRTDNTQAQ